MKILPDIHLSYYFPHFQHKMLLILMTIGFHRSSPRPRLIESSVLLTRANECEYETTYRLLWLISANTVGTVSTLAARRSTFCKQNNLLIRHTPPWIVWLRRLRLLVWWWSENALKRMLVFNAFWMRSTQNHKFQFRILFAIHTAMTTRSILRRSSAQLIIALIINFLLLSIHQLANKELMHYAFLYCANKRNVTNLGALN